MEKLEVNSSNIVSAEYDEENKVLYLDFTKGGKYKYLNFLGNSWEEFKTADSKGVFFHSRIKTGGYVYEKC